MCVLSQLKNAMLGLGLRGHTLTSAITVSIDKAHPPTHPG